MSRLYTLLRNQFCKLQHGGSHNFSSEDVAPNVEAPNVEFHPLGHWSIPVAHVDDALAVVHEDPSLTDIYAIAVGKTFLEKKDLVIAVGKWHMQRQVEYTVSRSSKSRLTVICKQNETCPFKLVASSKGGLWMVTKLEDNHTCRLDLTRNAPRKLSSRVIADLFRKRILDVGSILKPRAMIAEILREYGIEVGYSVALRARNLAIEMVYGSHDQSFAVLPAYLEILKRFNPDTVYDLETDSDDRFMYTFVALGVCRAAFSICMRPVIAIDGTHLKGKTKGILFVAVTKDGNEQCFPLAIGVGPIENDAAWTWFMERFKRAFGDRDDLVIVSDQHVSIKNAVKAVFPTAVRRLCYYHIVKNLIRAGHHVISMFKSAAFAYREEKFLKYLSMISSSRKEVYNTLLSIGVHRWARSQCPSRRYSFMTSNAAECFNAHLLWARRLPICSLIEVVRDVIEKWFDERRAKTVLRDHILIEFAYTKLYRQVEMSHQYGVRCHNAHLYKVQKNDKSFLVDLHMRTCECGEFQLDQIPCSYAAAAIRSAVHDIYDYVDLYFKQVTLCLAYHDRVRSVPSQDKWTVSSSFKVCPSKSVPQASRPKEGRYRSAGEGSSTRSRRQQVCSRCGGTSHNRKKCTAPQQIEHSQSEALGEGQRRPKRCSICREPGHSKDKCPNRVQPQI
ncbi:hypothetical protein C2S53_002673 [Perilla frutescens var. hirtella]|uniref:SWIM-type domain-containing protein n=1 Tax=Perilla frutescens var. hirtella TaxID=608512 RepID=A0AAD4IP03_PERFH|nr:hypothetical protein C2S53_002673 [Perilla frutescens var. hirtella]